MGKPRRGSNYLGSLTAHIPAVTPGEHAFDCGA